MNIRRAGALEADALTRIAKASKNYRNSLEILDTELKKPRIITPEYIFWNEVFAAETKTEVAAFYALAAKGGKIQLEHFLIKPEYDIFETSRKLMNHLLEQAIKLNAESIEIVSEQNTLEFFQKLGAACFDNEVVQFKDGRRILHRLQIRLSGDRRAQNKIFVGKAADYCVNLSVTDSR
jgi:hypothetical protein